MRPKFILWISTKNKKNSQEFHKLRDKLLAVIKVTKKTLRKREEGGGGQEASKKQKIVT